MAIVEKSHSAPPLAPTDQPDPIAALRAENAQLKRSLLQIREDYSELQEDSKYQQVKVAELQDILQLRNKDAISEKLVTTSMQNAELTFEIGRLRKELDKSTLSVQKLGGQREQSKVMLLELCDIVKALQSVDVEYEAAAGSEDAQSMSLKNIKKKVETIMEDRRLLVMRCKELERANNDKAEKLLSLEAQYHLLNSMNYAQGGNTGPKNPLEPTESQDDESAQSTNHSSSISVTLVEPLDIDLNVIRSPVKSITSQDEDTCAPSEEASAFSSVQVQAMHAADQSEEVERLKTELEESNQRYQHFMAICQTAFTKMKDVEQRFTQVQMDLDDVTEKRNYLRQHLKDVIDQYKELNEDHNNVVVTLEEANAKISALEKLVKKLEQAKKDEEEQGIQVLKESGLSNDVDALTQAYLKAKETISSLEKELASTKRAVEEAENKHKSSSNKFRNSVAQCQKLKLDKAELESKLSEADREIMSTKREMLRHKSEANNARRRLTSYMKGKVNPVVDVSKLQEIKESNQQKLLLLEASATGKAWSKRYSILQEKRQLAMENKDLRALCVEMLNDMGSSPKQ